MTRPTKEVVSWICHVCQAEFHTMDGGICYRCSEPTCRMHLSRLKQEKEGKTEWVCDNCLTEEEAKKLKNKCGWTS